MNPNKSATTAYAFLCHLILQRLLSESKLQKLNRSVFGVCFSLDCLQPEWSCVSGNWQLFSLSELSRNKQEHCHCCCRWRARIILANYSELFLIDKSIYVYINFIALVDLVKQVSYLDTNKTLLWWCIILFYYVTHVLSWFLTSKSVYAYNHSSAGITLYVRVL